MFRFPVCRVSVSLLVASIFTGCAGPNIATAPPISVTTLASNASPFFPGKRDAGFKSAEVRVPGMTYLSVGPLMGVRECNVEMTHCALGVAKLTSHTTLLSADNAGATIKVDLVFDLDRKQEITSTNSVSSDSIPDDIPVLTDAGTFTKIVRIPFGEMRRVSFSHGIDFNICALPANPKTLMPDDDRCNIDGLMTGKTAESSVPAL